MQHDRRTILAAAVAVASLLAMSAPGLAHDVDVNQPNCDSRARVAEKLTDDRDNRQYFERIGPGQFLYEGPEVDIYVKRDYIVYGFGGTLVQHDRATLDRFRAVCLPRPDAPYTYWPPQGCLDGVETGDERSALGWVSNSLGGRSNDWELFGFFRGSAVFAYEGPRVLFSVPKDALVWPLRGGGYGTPVTPGYELWEEAFRLTCFGS